MNDEPCPPHAPGWLSISRYALRYGISRGTVHKWLREHRLVTYRVDSLVRIQDITPAEHFQRTKLATDLSTAVQTGK